MGVVTLPADGSEDTLTTTPGPIPTRDSTRRHRSIRLTGVVMLCACSLLAAMTARRRRHRPTQRGRPLKQRRPAPHPRPRRLLGRESDPLGNAVGFFGVGLIEEFQGRVPRLGHRGRPGPGWIRMERGLTGRQLLGRPTEWQRRYGSFTRSTKPHSRSTHSSGWSRSSTAGPGAPRTRRPAEVEPTMVR
jgi:hypothetical protein